MMQDRFTYSTQSRVPLMLYVAPGYQPPDIIEVTGPDGKLVEFIRLSDMSLTCTPNAKGKGSCDDFDCHRREPGKCQCGRHKYPVRFSRATNEIGIHNV